MLQHFAKHGDEGHGGGNFAAIAAVVEFAEKFVVVGNEGCGADFALWSISTEGFATSFEIRDFLAVLGRAIERNIADIAVAEMHDEAGAELAEFLFVQLLLLVSDVFAFASFAEALTLDSEGEDERGAAVVFEGGFVGGIDFAGIVSTKTQATQSLVGKRLNELQEARIAAEEKLPNIVARRNDEFLIFAVDDLAHALDEKALGVAFEDGIPLAAPENLDDVPASTAETAVQLLNNLAVAAHGA